MNNIERHLSLARSEAGYTASSRRHLCGGSAAHQRSVRAYNRTSRRYSRALCAVALADHLVAVAEAREQARQEALIAREDEIAAETGPMRLWQVTRTCRGGYDTYSDFVVAAATAEQARRIHPSEYHRWDRAAQRFVSKHDGEPSEHEDYGSWLDAIDTLKVIEIGAAAEAVLHGQVLCASFHAG